MELLKYIMALLLYSSETWKGSWSTRLQIWRDCVLPHIPFPGFSASWTAASGQQRFSIQIREIFLVCYRGEL